MAIQRNGYKGTGLGRPASMHVLPAPSHLLSPCTCNLPTHIHHCPAPLTCPLPFTPPCACPLTSTTDLPPRPLIFTALPQMNTVSKGSEAKAARHNSSPSRTPPRASSPPHIVVAACVPRQAEGISPVSALEPPPPPSAPPPWPTQHADAVQAAAQCTDAILAGSHTATQTDFPMMESTPFPALCTERSEGENEDEAGSQLLPSS